MQSRNTVQRQRDCSGGQGDRFNFDGVRWYHLAQDKQGEIKTLETRLPWVNSEIRLRWWPLQQLNPTEYLERSKTNLTGSRLIVDASEPDSQEAIVGADTDEERGPANGWESNAVSEAVPGFVNEIASQAGRPSQIELWVRKSDSRCVPWAGLKVL